MVCVDGPKLDGENPKVMAVTNGQTFRTEPLSSKTDDTLQPEQATSMNDSFLLGVSTDSCPAGAP